MTSVVRGKPTVAVDTRAEGGEGPVWDDRAGELLWVDSLKGEVHSYAPTDGSRRVMACGQAVGVALPRSGGGLVLTLRDGVGLVDSWGDLPRVVVELEREITINRLNDAYCDATGRLWAGSFADDERPNAGKLYRISCDYTVETVLDPVGVSNGIGWSPDNSVMYYIDSPTQCLEAFDYDVATGAVANRRVVAEISEELGGPDGLAVDAQGKIWVALCPGGKVLRYSEGGALLERIDLPTQSTTSCAFGGPDLSRLYITTGTDGLTDAQLKREPFAGSVLCLDTTVTGIPTHPFCG
jgi:sugar lactone lactonase YvrE